MESTMALSASESNSGGTLRTVVKSAVLSFVLSLVMVLVFALVVKLANVSGTTVGVINQIIKILSAFLGVLFAVNERNAWLVKGTLGGALFAVLAFVTFSLIGGSFNWGSLIVDVLLCAVAGAVAALLAGGKK